MDILAATVRTPDGDDVVVEEDEELIEGDEGDGEEDEWEDEAAEEVKPTWFRWVSRAVPIDALPTVPRSNGDGTGVGVTTSPEGEKMQVDGEISSPGTKKLETVERKMVLSFSVPLSLVPEPISESPMDIDGPRPPPPPTTLIGNIPNKPSTPAICAIAGCGAKRKYRLVRDWTIGACGMGHLKVLEAGV
jgi:Ino eighty subunit 2